MRITTLYTLSTSSPFNSKLPCNASLYRSQEISQHAEAEARDSTRQLVALQQRLATLKDAVAAAQRVAAAREAAAAVAIQRNAAETAAELQKQDVDKQISQSEQEAKVVLQNALHSSYFLIKWILFDIITRKASLFDRTAAQYFHWRFLYRVLYITLETREKKHVRNVSNMLFVKRVYMIVTVKKLKTCIFIIVLFVVVIVLWSSNIGLFLTWHCLRLLHEQEKDILAAKENAVANAVQQASFVKPSHQPWGWSGIHYVYTIYISVWGICYMFTRWWYMKSVIL